MNKKGAPIFFCFVIFSVLCNRTIYGSDSPFAKASADRPPGKQAQTAIINSAPGVGKDINIQLNIPIQNDSSNRNMLTNTIDLMVELKNKLVNYIKLINSVELTNYNHFVTTLKQSIKISGQDIQRRSVNFLHQTKELVLDHKYKLVAIGFISFYSYILFKVISVNKYLKQDSLWSSWKQEQSMDQLLTAPQKQFAHELVSRIQGRYIDQHDPANAMSPFISFSEDIAYEIAQLQSHIKLYTWIKNLKVWRLFPSCAETQQQIQERIQRLIYFKNSFSSWLAQYKLEELKKVVKKKMKRCKKSVEIKENYRKDADLLYQTVAKHLLLLELNKA